MQKAIKIKTLPDIQLAYISGKGIQNLKKNYQRLSEWALNENLIDQNTKMLTIFKDSFKNTSPDQVRMDSCLVVDRTINETDVIQYKIMKPETCIVGRFELKMEEFKKRTKIE